MNSYNDDDRTLPVDFNGSANPETLTDVQWNSHLEYADGSKPMVAKAGSGRMSPVRARTMKEYDHQIAELKKENFSLKLRIYFLEERVQQKYDGDGEDLFKTTTNENIELKVEVESLKQELLDKQDLLKKASTALESISAQHQVELQQAQEATGTTLDDKLRELQGQLDAKEEELGLARRKLDEAQKELLDVATTNKQLMTRLDSNDLLGDSPQQPASNNAALEEKDKYIRQLQSVLKTKELIIEQQDEERKEAFTEAQRQMEDLKKSLSTKEKREKDLDIQLEKLERENLVHEENALKRDKAIQGLAAALQNKAREGQDGGSDEVLELQDRLAELGALNDRLEKTVSRREAEVVRLTQQLEKADDSVRNREDGLQAMLDDTQRQLQNQEKMLQHLSKSLQDKDRQLHDYMHMVQEQQPSSEKQDSIINNLRNQLRDKEEAIQVAIDDKYQALEERDGEIRQLKMTIRERDRDLERANQMLLTTEDTIDTLNSEAKERDQALRQTTANLKAQQRANEEQEDAFQRALDEKEILIQRLQNSLNLKDKTLQDTIRASPSATDAMIQQLQQRLQDKDNLVQEVMLERSRTAETVEATNRDLVNKVRSKDRELKDVQARTNQDLSDLTRQLQGLQSDLNKKDYELQTMENRATRSEEQQQENLDKMRSANNEKDKTIEALVASTREKDRLLRQMQEQSPDIFSGGSAASKLAELQQAKDEVARLHNELRNKADLIDRLRLAAERRSPKPDMVPRRQLDDTEEELAQRTENELRKRLKAMGVADLSDIGKLREEIERLRRAAERPGTPQRLETTVGGETNLHLTQMLRDQLQEAQRLSDALRMEREIYVNINQVGNAPQSDQARAFEIELSAVQSLRKQLADGVDRNNKIRATLEAQLEATSGKTTDGSTNAENRESLDAMAAKVRSLQTQLEESSRWNTSLQARLSQQPVSQQRGGGVGGAQDTTDSILRTPTRHSTSMLHDSMYSGSFMPSFRQLPESVVPSNEDLERMSPHELKEMVLKLKDELLTSQACCESLQAQLSSLSPLPRTIPGENTQEPATFDSQKVAELEKDVSKLRHQLKHTEHLNELLKQQIKLNTQSDNSSTGFNPELVVQMANEIQRLKDELEKRRQSTDSMGVWSMSGQLSPIGKNGVEAQKAVQKQMESMRSDYNDQKAAEEEDLEVQNKMLRGKLASTEATVRSQTEKVRHYRRLLEDAGLLTPLHRRSCSESSLSNLGVADAGRPPSGAGNRLSSASTGNLSGARASSEETLPNLKNRKSLSSGHRTLAKLRHRVEECRDLTSEMTSQSRLTESADVRVSRAASVREKLAEAANLCTSLAVHLDGKDPSSVLGSEHDLTDLTARHEAALEKIEQLEQGILPGGIEATSLVKKLSQLEKDHAEVTQHSAVLEVEVGKLRKQLSKEQKRAANEREQLKAIIDKRDELLTENKVVAEKLQTELLRMKAEIKRLQKRDVEGRPETVNGDSKMSDSIERLRHKTGDSSTSPPLPTPGYTPEVDRDNSTTSLNGVSSEQMSRKVLNDTGSFRMSASELSIKSPEKARARHPTTGSETEVRMVEVVVSGSPSSNQGDHTWTTGTSGSPGMTQNLRDQQELERLRREVSELTRRLEDKSGELSESDAKLQMAHRDLRRLSEEVGRLHQELEEKHNLNNTLQMELEVYDRIHSDQSRLDSSRDSPSKSGPQQIDLTLLLEELRQLRQQLVKTIENNNGLRQKLEEQLKQGRPPAQQVHHYYVNGDGAHQTVPGQASGQVSINGHVTADGHTPPDQMDRLHETDVAPGLRTEDLWSAPSAQTWQRSAGRQQPLGGKDPLRTPRHGDTVDGLTKSQGYGDGSMRYSIHDPMRPPNLSSTRVGSDLRSLYAIGELDDYELLKKEIGESISLLKTCEARIKERLRHFQRASPSQNTEHSTLRGTSASLEQLAFCLNEQLRLVKLFWTSQLPRRDDRGNQVDVNMNREHRHLQEQLATLASKYAQARKDLLSAERKLMEKNNDKEKREANIIKNLTRHSDTLSSVEKNLERR